MKRRVAVAAAIALLLACAGATGAFAQEDSMAADDDASSSASSDAIFPPPARKPSAINVNSTESRGAVKAIDCLPSANGTITVTGSGRASGAPDVARIRMTVESREQNAADARSKAAETTQAVLDALSQFPGAEARSTSVSVYAQRDTQGGVTRTTGFEFRQSLSVTLSSPGSDNSRRKNGSKNATKGNENDATATNTTTASDTLASLASRALDAAIAAGGDRLSIDNLEFELAPERASEAVKLARSRALVDLRDKAERDASGLGLTLGALQSVRVDPYARSGEPRSMRGAAAVAMSSSSPEAKSGPGTPLSSPNSETEVTVEGVYRVCSPSS